MNRRPSAVKPSTCTARPIEQHTQVRRPEKRRHCSEGAENVFQKKHIQQEGFEGDIGAHILVELKTHGKWKGELITKGLKREYLQELHMNLHHFHPLQVYTNPSSE